MIVSHMETNFHKFGVRGDECIWVEGEPYFSVEALGKFLELIQPRIALNKIMRNNHYIKEYMRDLAISEKIEIKKRGVLLDTEMVYRNNTNHKSKRPKNQNSFYKKGFWPPEANYLKYKEF